MTTLLQRARALTDMYRIRRQRHTPPLTEQLREHWTFGPDGAGLSRSATLDSIAEVMHAHPDCVSVEVDYGLSSLAAEWSHGKHPGAYGFAIAYSHGGNLLARVDVDPDGTLTLIPDEEHSR